MTYEVGPSIKLARSNRLQSLPCAKCDKDTPHKGAECIYCGSLNINPVVARHARNKEARAKMTYTERMFRGERERNAISRARREALAKAAEESRKKWEGK